MSYSDCHYWALSTMCTYDVYLQSVSDKMVRQTSLEVREKVRELFFLNVGNHVKCTKTYTHCTRQYL